VEMMFCRIVLIAVLQIPRNNDYKKYLHQSRQLSNTHTRKIMANDVEVAAFGN
jgi:hypothetical protein